MAKEPQQLGERLQAIEDRLDELDQESFVLHTIWEHVTLPVLGLLAASPPHQQMLADMVDKAEASANQIVAEEDQWRYRRRYDLLRAHLAGGDGVAPSL